jgi:hypothetical protein
MKFPVPAAIAVAALLFVSSADAQLKLPKGESAAGKPSAAAASAATPAPAVDSATAEKEAAGKLAAQGWLVLLDRRDWGRAWETSSAVFRTTVPLGTWMDGIPKLREAFGALVERAPADSVYKTTLAGRPDGEYVTVIFLAKFEKRELQEVVTVVREADGKWRVTGYETR